MARDEGGGQTAVIVMPEPAMSPLRRHVLFSLACLPWGVRADPPRSGGLADPLPAGALMLARVAAMDVDPQGFLVSEKFDGVRAFWDGRTLRHRSGHPLSAPAWFTQRLPREPLDGELWLGRGQFDAVSALVRRARAMDADWRSLHYQVFDQPGTPGPFADRARRLSELLARHAVPRVTAVPQRRVSDAAALQGWLASVVAGGGEGLMLHRAAAWWQKGRSGDLLKLKPAQDDEAVVVAYMPGKGRHQGRLGALRVRDANGREWLLGTGFSDAERDHPPPLGQRITYTYQGTTSSGLPRFARYLRVRND
jgi:DNA ligase 1